MDIFCPARVKQEGVRESKMSSISRRKMQNELFSPATCSVAGTSAFSLRLQPHPAEKFVSKFIKEELVLPAGSKK